MVIGTIKQQGTLLITETNEIAYQYASNLQLSVNFMDGFFDGYSLVWLFAHDMDSPKTGILLYDSVQKKLTLPPEAFQKDGRLYISMRALKDDVVIPTSPVEFYITQTLNPDATNIPHEAGWEEIAKNLIEQVFENEYKPVMEQLKKNVDDTVNDVKQKLANGDFIGPLGPQGVGYRYRGDWVINTSYASVNEGAMDTVKYGGELYLCIVSHRSTASLTPTNLTYWNKIVSKGDKGETVELRASGNDIQYKHNSDTAWQNLFGINQIQGLVTGWGTNLDEGAYANDLSALSTEKTKVIPFSNALNTPLDLRTGVLMNISLTQDYVKQIAFDIRSGNDEVMYMRSYKAGNWSRWIEFYTEKNLGYVQFGSLVINPGGTSSYIMQVRTVVTDGKPRVIASISDITMSDIFIMGTTVNTEDCNITFHFNKSVNRNININYMIFYVN